MEVRLVEIFSSIQGEGPSVGEPTLFVRFGGCDLRCRWCDSPHTWRPPGRCRFELEPGGERFREVDNPVEVATVLEAARALEVGTHRFVSLTGGEPLLQPGAIPLLQELCDSGRTVLLETSGERDISGVDPRVHRIMDLKAPGSDESHRNRWENIEHLSQRDEVKVVLSDRADYDWAKAVIQEHDLASRVNAVLLSCVWGELDPKDLVQWVLEDRLPVRVQMQMHKLIWDADTQGV